MFHDGDCPRGLHERFQILVVARVRVAVVRAPPARIEPDAIVPGISAQPGTQAITLDVKETILHRVFLTADEMLRMFRQEPVHFRVALHVGDWHHVGRIVGLREAHHEVAAITVADLQDVAEERQALQEGRRGDAVLVLVPDPPKLFGEVPPMKFGYFRK